MPLNRTSICIHTAIAIAAFHACISAAHAQITVRHVNTIRWGTSDGSVGLQGATVEDFEDVNLAPGLSVFWNATAGTLGPVTVLPRTFAPDTDDPFGSAFAGGRLGRHPRPDLRAGQPVLQLQRLSELGRP